jgi:hypothetical protein
MLSVVLDTIINLKSDAKRIGGLQLGRGLQGACVQIANQAYRAIEDEY